MSEEITGKSENQYGVELLKKFIKESIELGRVIEDRLKDGWQWQDLLPILVEAKDLSFVIKNWNEIREEFQDLTEEEIVELVKSTVGELGVSDEEILELIDCIIDFAQSTYHLVLAFKALKK